MKRVDVVRRAWMMDGDERDGDGRGWGWGC